jgi:hypothetical protein
MSIKSIKMLDDAIASHQFPPRFIVLDIELFSLLKEAGRITDDHNPTEVDPVLDEKIFVLLVNVQDPLGYKLPSHPCAA